MFQLNIIHNQIQIKNIQTGKLLQQYTTQRPDDEIIKPLIDSLAGVQYTDYISLAVEQSMLGDPDTTKINVDFR